MNVFKFLTCLTVATDLLFLKEKKLYSIFRSLKDMIYMNWNLQIIGISEISIEKYSQVNIIIEPDISFRV